MKRKILSLVFVCIFTTSLFAGCSKNDGTGKAFSYPISAIPLSLDPQIASDLNTKIIINNCFEGLVRLDSSGNIVCAAAESYTVSDNGLEYIFNIRQNAKWHLTSAFKDVLGENYEESFNTDLTAQDFVFAFQRAVNPQTGAENASLLYPIKNADQINNGRMNVHALGVSALDNKTLKIELSHPYPDFLTVLAQPICMPCNQKFFEATSGRYGRDAEYTLCNGPFYLSKITEDTSVSLVKNPDYFGLSEVFPSSVTFKIIDKDSTIAENIVSGSLSSAIISSEEYELLKDEKNITTLNSTNIVWAFCFNNSVTALQNYNLRRALCSCIDRNLFSKSAFNSSIATGLVPPSCSSSNNEKISFPASSNVSELWKTALTELDKSDIDLTITCAAEHEFDVRAQLQAWQKEFGLSCNIKVKPVERADLETALRNGSYEIAFAPISTRQSSKLHFLNMFAQDTKQNVINYSSKKYFDIISKALTAENKATLDSLCNQAEQFLLNDCVLYPVFYENSYLVMAKDVSGINASPSFEFIDFISAVRK